jgi:hypothetical protein
MLKGILLYSTSSTVTAARGTRCLLLPCARSAAVPASVFLQARVAFHSSTHVSARWIGRLRCSPCVEACDVGAVGSTRAFHAAYDHEYFTLLQHRFRLTFDVFRCPFTFLPFQYRAALRRMERRFKQSCRELSVPVPACRWRLIRNLRPG